MAEAAARALCAGGLAVVPVQPPPQYVLALAWRRGEQAAAAQRFLAYLRTYRDRHQRITGPSWHRRHTTVTRPHCQRQLSTQAIGQRAPRLR
jgi:hypothetical protein